MKQVLIFTVFWLNSNNLFAQPHNVRVQEHYAVGLALGKNTSATTLTYNQMLVFGKNYIFHAGTGFRLTSYSQTGRDFVGISKNMMGARITSFPKGKMNALNLPVFFELHGKKALIGFNVDLLGFSFGKKRDSLTLVGAKRPDSLFVKPTIVNFLGRGTNNAEIYIGFKPIDELTVKFGLSFLFAEYHARYRYAKKDVDFGRFYQSAMMPFISIVINADR
jgi:hypothetical protein